MLFVLVVEGKWKKVQKYVISIFIILFSRVGEIVWEREEVVSFGVKVRGVGGEESSWFIVKGKVGVK